MFEKIKIEALVEKPIDITWKSYTDPKHMVNWNFASEDWHCPFAENDLRVGGVMKARMEAKDGSFGFEFSGTYIELEQESLIEYVIPDGRHVRTTFEKEGTGTKVITVFDAEKMNSLEMQKNGWQSILDNYKKYTESLT